MRRSLALSLLAAFAALLLADNPIAANVIAPSLPPGSQYQVIFVTFGGHNAGSTDIEVYNSFVNDEAALGVPFGLPDTGWHAVASTDDDDANSNAPSALPVYNTAGELVAAGGIYTGSLNNLVAYDQYGDYNFGAQFDHVWTGSDDAGFGIAGATLGSASGDAEIGQLATDGTWLEFAVAAQFDEVAVSKPLYALSNVITVVPEPSTFALAGFALLAIGAAGRRRRR